MKNDPIDRDGLRPQFWKRYPLEDLPHAEWEALCDGCGKCCLIKLEDEDSGDIHYTNIACRLLDDASCRCGNYALRQQLVKSCVIVRPDNLESILDWMPKTCAYRIVANGQDLPDWHPLISGDPDSVRRAGVSMQGRTVGEYDVEEDDWPDYVLDEEF